MYQQREKEDHKKTTKAQNVIRKAASQTLVHNAFAHRPNGLLQRQDKAQIRPFAAQPFVPKSTTIQMVDDKDKDKTDHTSENLDNLQLSLELLGLTPGVGAFADAANVGLSLFRGNYKDALINLGAMVPVVGQGVTGSKLAAKAVSSATDALGAAKAKTAEKLVDNADIGAVRSALKDTVGKTSTSTTQAERVGPEDIPKATSQTVPDSVTRRDNDFSATTNHKDKKKSYIDEDGTLTPANPDGNITVQQHVRGADPAKGNSQYTSTTAVDDVATTTPKDYGNNTIEIDTKRLQQDIDTGKVKDVEILPPKRVQAELQGNIDKAQARYDANPSQRNSDKLQDAKRDLDNAVRDNECLIKGCVPSDYIQGGQ